MIAGPPRCIAAMNSQALARLIVTCDDAERILQPKSSAKALGCT